MADYRAISTGVYSDLARWEVWNGSAWVAATQLPTIADDVYANGFTVTIDVDSFASSYRTTGISGVAASGGFVLNGGITAIGDVYAGGTTCITHSDVNDSFVIGNSLGSLTNATRHGIFGTGTGTIHLTGTPKGGGILGANIISGCSGIRSTGSGSFVVYGNTEAGTGSRSTGAYSIGAVRGRVYGMAIGASGNNRYGAVNCIVDECASYNQDLIVTSKFIHDINNNLQGLVNCRAQDGAPVQVEIYDESGNAITLNPIAAQGHAAPADVRSGTSYANGALTGTLAVPPAGSVSLGVPVDNTTGTGSVSSAEIRDLILPSILSAITQP